MWKLDLDPWGRTVRGRLSSLSLLEQPTEVASVLFKGKPHTGYNRYKTLQKWETVICTPKLARLARLTREPPYNLKQEVKYYLAFEKEIPMIQP